MRDDILALTGPTLECRHELFNFIVEEIEKREPLCPYKIRPVRRMLQNQQKTLLAFVGILEKRFAELADELEIPLFIVHAVYDLQGCNNASIAYWERRCKLQKILGYKFFSTEQAVQEILDDTPRASSLVENFNSRLRNYFFLRRHIGNDYLELLQFFLNHRRFMRSEKSKRVGLSPLEIMTGKTQPHWLESLDFDRFQRA